MVYVYWSKVNYLIQLALSASADWIINTHLFVYLFVGLFGVGEHAVTDSSLSVGSVGLVVIRFGYWYLLCFASKDEAYRSADIIWLQQICQCDCCWSSDWRAWFVLFTYFLFFISFSFALFILLFIILMLCCCMPVDFAGHLYVLSVCEWLYFLCSSGSH